MFVYLHLSLNTNGLLAEILLRSTKIMYRLLIRLLTFQFTIIRILFKSKNDLVLETIELR